MRTQFASKEVYKEERLKAWPGFSSEVSTIYNEIVISDVNKEYVSNRTIRRAIYNQHYIDMKKALGSSSQLESKRHEDFRQPQRYMLEKSIYYGRLAYRIRSQMVDEIPTILQK